MPKEDQKSRTGQSCSLIIWTPASILISIETYLNRLVNGPSHDANGTRHCFIIKNMKHYSHKVVQSDDPSLKLKTKEGGLVLEEGLEQRRGSRCCAFPAARFEPSLSRPLLTPRCPGWWGFLSKLPSSNHPPLHQPLHCIASNYLRCTHLFALQLSIWS